MGKKGGKRKGQVMVGASLDPSNPNLFSQAESKLLSNMGSSEHKKEVSPRVARENESEKQFTKLCNFLA